MTLIVWRSNTQVFCEMFLIWGFSDFFFLIKLALRVLGKNDTEGKNVTPCQGHVVAA